MSKWKMPTDKEKEMIVAMGVDPQMTAVVNRIDEDSIVVLVLKTGQEIYIRNCPKD